MRSSKSFVLLTGITVVGLIAIGSFAQGQGKGQGGPDVTVVNTTSNPVPVVGALEVSGGVIAAQQSGTWSVELNDPVTLAKQAPITDGGGGNNMGAGDTLNYGPPGHEASAVMVWFTGGSTELILSFNDQTVARLRSSGTGATESVQLALSRPVKFTKASCFGGAGRCNFSWIGNAP